MPACPLLDENNKCTVYHLPNRWKCCVAFPARDKPHFCTDAHRCDLNCTECKDVCCKNISFNFKSDNYTVEDFKKALDISCEECDQIWCK